MVVGSSLCATASLDKYQLVSSSVCGCVLIYSLVPGWDFDPLGAWCCHMLQSLRHIVQMPSFVWAAQSVHLGCTVRTSQAKKTNNLVKRFSVFILTCMYTLYGFFIFFILDFLGGFYYY